MFAAALVLSLLGLGSVAAAPARQASDLSARGQFDGTATYYYQGGNPGSCGDYHSDNDWIVAVNAPQQSGSCGRKVKITNTDNGKTATALAADTCPGCAWGSLDMSEGLFSYLADGNMGLGVFSITWDYTSDE